MANFSIYFATWSYDDIDFGDTDNKGCETENEKYEAGDLDGIIRRYGYFEPSSTEIDEYTYFYSIDSEEDYTTGDITEYTLHFKGVSLASKRRIARYLSNHRITIT